MNTRLLHQLPPTDNNPRNSEGAFVNVSVGGVIELRGE